MPRVIRVPQNKIEIVFDERDLENLIYTHIGSDARDYFHELIEGYIETISELQDEIKELEKEWATPLEQAHNKRGDKNADSI